MGQSRAGASPDEFLWGGRTVAQWVPEILAELGRRFEPLKIILFGSLARGSDGCDSDIDLLVVLPRVEDKRATAIALRHAVAGLPPPVDVIPTDPEEIARRGHVIGTVLEAALTEGTVVYERAG